MIQSQEPACRCGVPKKPDSTVYGRDDGRCFRHPERGFDAWKKKESNGEHDS